ncbi:MAG: transporter binding protein [Chthonomonadales bacterium]|nr:transporter binding protein [Chthonomonadales bacterium]
MPKNAITVQNVSKRYCRNLKQGMLYTMVDVAHDTLGLRQDRSVLRKGEFWSLQDVSFELKQGDCMGLIGVNGAGKSTLLKLLNGLIRPDEGVIRVAGRVGALIEVGAGFHPMLSGRENIYVNGAILGMSKREIDQKYDSIVDFAELSADILEAPVKTYSSGMYVRLGFSVAIHCEPDVLLIDEVLAVGDARFIGKCRLRLQQLLNSGVSCIIVSHSLNMIEAFCSHAVLLDAGRILEAGPGKIATTRYRQMILEGKTMPKRAKEVIERSGVAIIGVQLLDDADQPIEELPSGGMGTLEVNLRTVTPLQQGILTLSMQRRPDGLVPLSSSLEIGRDIRCLETGVYRFRLPFIPMPGTYTAWATITGTSKLEILDEAASRSFEITVGTNAPERLVGDSTQGACVLPPAYVQICNFARGEYLDDRCTG